MLAGDIIKQLLINLPKYSDKFTNNTSVTSLTLSGTTATAICTGDHGLAVNDPVNIVGADSPIDIVSINRVGVELTVVTLTSHDFTFDRYNDQFANLDGSTEIEFNGSFKITSVPNRFTLTLETTDAGATSATGSPQLLNGWSFLQDFNGLHQVTATPTTNSFQYEVTTIPPTNTASGTIQAKALPRVSGAATEEILINALTRQLPDSWWSFVVLGDVVASKSRRIDSDATDNQQHGNEYRQQIVQPFSIIVYVPVKDELAAREARDECETLFRALCKSVLFSKFDSGLHVGAQNPVSFVNHGAVAYNSSFYAHLYRFESVADITFDDTVGRDVDVAFRDIDLSIFPNIGTNEDDLTVNNINLDEQP